MIFISLSPLCLPQEVKEKEGKKERYGTQPDKVQSFFFCLLASSKKKEVHPREGRRKRLLIAG